MAPGSGGATRIRKRLSESGDRLLIASQYPLSLMTGRMRRIVAYNILVGAVSVRKFAW